MKKTIVIIILLVFFIIAWSYSTNNHILRGFYQTEVDGYHIQMLFQLADQSFIQWIDNRQVDQGSYEKIDTNLYRISSELQNFEISLNRDNSFSLIISQLNSGEPIMMQNITPKDHSISFGEWGDIDKYKSLLD